MKNSVSSKVVGRVLGKVFDSSKVGIAISSKLVMLNFENWNHLERWFLSFLLKKDFP